MEYSEKDHLEDYIKINKSLKNQINNYKHEAGGVKLECLIYRLNEWFSDEKIESIKNER